METLVLMEPGRFTLTETALPAPPGPGEALVRVHRVGVCGTDLHAFKGEQPFFSYPRILGHELGVEVIALGDGAADTGLAVGDRCAVEPYLHCGTCVACRQGKTNCCVRLQVLGVHTDGGMREFITAPADKLRRSSTLSYEQLALVEMLGIGAHAVGRAAIVPGEFALVIGAGPIGLSTLAFAQQAGAQTIALDLAPGRLDFARQALGVGHTVRAGDGALDELLAITNGDLPTAVFDATGNAASMHNAFRYVASGGRLIFVGLFQGDITFNDPDFHRRELTILATRNATGADHYRIIAALEAGAFDPAGWITHRASPEATVEQFAGWLHPETGVIKAMVTF
ncbi:MAG: zinc-binding alcohol dehydrogenase family protein [Thermomicrobiales bacterium]